MSQDSAISNQFVPAGRGRQSPVLSGLLEGRCRSAHQRGATPRASNGLQSVRRSQSNRGRCAAGHAAPDNSVARFGRLPATDGGCSRDDVRAADAVSRFAKAWTTSIARWHLRDSQIAVHALTFVRPSAPWELLSAKPCGNRMCSESSWFAPPSRAD
jgi:hypothetical protein